MHNLLMYGGIPKGKKVIQRREEEKKRENHLERLRNVRPSTTAYEEAPRMLNHGKRQMQMEDRFTEIERENRLLLEKITTNMARRGSREGERERMNRSLNSNFRRKQLQDIEIENARLLRRLQDKKSDYDAGRLKSEWKKQKKVIQNIANYPLILRDGTRRERSRRAMSRGFDSLNNNDRNALGGPIEFMRIRNVDGTNMIVTIKLDEEKLTILGDMKKGKEVKIIEIPREEAL